MVKRRRSPDCDGTTTDAAAYNTVFIDTSIDTHLALITADSDTVSDLKNNIVLEHGLCFPEIGLVKICAIKVKRKGSFYHLPDYMFVKSAFKGVNKTWYLYVDFSKCNDVSQNVELGATFQRALITTNMHDQDHLHDDHVKIPCDVHKVEVGDVENKSSSKIECNIPASTQEFKDDNVPHDVTNLGSSSSSQSVETCNSAKKLERKHNSLLPTLASKDNTMSPQALDCNNVHFETGNTTVNTQKNKAGKLLGSHVESEPHIDGQEMSSSNVKKSKKRNRKGSLRLHEETHSSHSLEKCMEVNECIEQNAESEKGCAFSLKDIVTAPASICSPAIPHSTHNDMPKMDRMDKIVEKNLLAVHDPEVNHTGELNPTQDGLEKLGESTLPSTLSDTKEVNAHLKRSKKRAKSSKSRIMDDHADQARHLTADSHLVLPITNGEELPESAESKKGRVSSGNHDMAELGHSGSLDIHHSLHDNMLKVDNINKTVERELFAVHDPEMRQTEEPYLLHCKSTVPSALLVTKEVVKTHESSRKKKSQISRPGVQDQHVDHSTDSPADFGLLFPNVAASDHQFCESTVEKGLCSSKPYANAVEQNLSTKIVHTDEATESVNRGGKKKKKKVKKSGVAVENQPNQESTVVENDLNLKQVPETVLSSKSPDVLKNCELNEAIEDGKAICEKKKKQKVEKAVARVQETVDKNREPDQINGIVSPPLGSPDPGENINCGAKKKKKKVKKSGTAAKDQQKRHNIAVENDLNLKQVPETELPSNSESPDVLQAVEVNESTEDGKAIGEKKKKQVEKAVARVQETVDMNRDADQTNDVVSPSLDIPDPGGLVPLTENDEIYQKIEERDILVNNNLEERVLSRDKLSCRDQMEPVTETVSNTNTSTAIAAGEQKMRGTRKKKRARKTVSGVCQDGMDTENTQTHTMPSSSEPNWPADLQAEKEKDFSPVPKGIEASSRKPSDASREKNTPPMESPLNQVPADLKSQKDEEVSESIGKEINFKQYFVPNQHQDEVIREPSVGTVAKKKREVAVPSIVSAPKHQQDLPESSKKDSIVSSSGKVNTLTESNRLTKTKKKIGKRGVPYATTSSELGEIRTPQKPVSSAFLNGSDATKTGPRKKEIVQSLAASGVYSSPKTPLKSNTRGKSESSLRHNVTTGKNTSSKLNGEIVNKSKQKSLGQTPRAIFRDVSSESSLDENGSVDSSASTRTPSDNQSSSSDLSDDAMGNGHDDNDNKGRSKKSVSNSEISGLRQIPLDTILKSSSRFKKAKLTASQQFEDPDSQLDDLFPETQ